MVNSLNSLPDEMIFSMIFTLSQSQGLSIVTGDNLYKKFEAPRFIVHFCNDAFFVGNWNVLSLSV